MRTTSYIDYDGPYIAPDDFPDMYRQVDVVWIAHYMGRSSTLWNRANRFYEACFFKKPMFAQIGTQDGQVVETLGIGVCIDLRDINGTVDRILNVSEVEFSQWQQNVAHLPTDIYTYTDEHEKIVNYLNIMS